MTLSRNVSGQPHGSLEDERRIHYDIRNIFDDACKLTADCFDSDLGTTMTMTARRRLHEIYPNLSHQEVALLFSAVRRYHQEKSHRH